VEALAKRYPQSALVVGGFSQGAMLTINLLETSSNRFQAAIIWSPADLLLTPLKGDRTETPRLSFTRKHRPSVALLGGKQAQRSS
jgi:predicted esterase